MLDEVEIVRDAIQRVYIHIQRVFYIFAYAEGVGCIGEGVCWNIALDTFGIGRCCSWTVLQRFDESIQLLGLGDKHISQSGPVLLLMVP